MVNAAGLPVEMNDAKGAFVVTNHDALLRPTDIWARDVTGEAVTLRQHLVYGEGLGDTLNHRGRLHQHYDEAGMLEFTAYDFKGNVLSKNRKVIKDSLILGVFSGPPTNWEVPVFRVDWDVMDDTDLESDDYETDYAYDGLNRATKVTLPLDLDTERKVVEAAFNRAGALESITLEGAPYVAHIAYNARGQRLLVAYGNDIMTRYAYDPDNFRLMRQRSEGYAHAVSSGTHTYAYQSGTLRQDNEYKYDLAGNIVWMKDGRGDSAAGGSGMLARDFEYDPLYRLLHDTGRESTSYTQAADPSVDLGVATGVANTRAYNRYYLYDRLGNMLQVSHVASGNTFNRDFNGYDAGGNPNPYEGGNLATGIDYGGTTVNYTFDDNGNMLTEGSSRHMEWDFGDRMRAYYTQAGTSEPSVYAHYLYGADGSRVKKLVRKSAGNEEVTVYIDGGFEYLYELDGSTREEEMNEIHVMDGRSRIARVQVHGGTWTGSTTDPVLYNLEDHLGHSSFTLTDTGGAYSQEEYFPFGETSFGSYAKKRYRFCGKERDEESGLYYYGARYYAPWSCRFVSIDPLAAKYPFYTPYQYAGNKPINFIDLDGLEQKEGPISSGSDFPSQKSPLLSKASGSANLVIVLADYELVSCGQYDEVNGFEQTGWDFVVVSKLSEATSWIRDHYEENSLSNILVKTHTGLARQEVPGEYLFGPAVVEVQQDPEQFVAPSFRELTLCNFTNADAEEAMNSLKEIAQVYSREDGNMVLSACQLGRRDMAPVQCAIFDFLGAKINLYLNSSDSYTPRMLENTIANGWGSITPPNLFNPDGMLKIDAKGYQYTGKNLVMLKSGGFKLVDNSVLVEMDEELILY